MMQPRHNPETGSEFIALEGWSERRHMQHLARTVDDEELVKYLAGAEQELKEQTRLEAQERGEEDAFKPFHTPRAYYHEELPIAEEHGEQVLLHLSEAAEYSPVDVLRNWVRGRFVRPARAQKMLDSYRASSEHNQNNSSVDTSK